MTPQPISLLIADDHPLFRRGLRDVIEREENFMVVAEVGTGVEALEAIDRYQPEIAILDYKMPDKTGLEVVRILAARNSPVSVIILTMCDEDELFRKAVDLGVMGYILKESAVHEIVKGIKTVANGEHYFSALIASRAIHTQTGKKTTVVGADGIATLTPMEQTILSLVAEYKSTTEIAETLCISPRTVENHRANICHKLHLSGRYSLVRYALSHKHPKQGVT